MRCTWTVKNTRTLKPAVNPPGVPLTVLRNFLVKILNPPLISKGVKKLKLKLSLVFRNLKTAQRGPPSLQSPGSNILRCQQGGFRPAKRGFRKFQKKVKNHGFKLETPKKYKSIRFLFFVDVATFS